MRKNHIVLYSFLCLLSLTAGAFLGYLPSREQVNIQKKSSVKQESVIDDSKEITVNPRPTPAPVYEEIHIPEPVVPANSVQEETETYLVRAHNESIGVFKLKNGIEELEYQVKVNLSVLPGIDRKALVDGITATNKNEVAQLIEDYTG